MLLALIEQALVLTPGKQAAGSGDAPETHEQQQREGKALHETFSGYVGVLSHGPHMSLESHVIRGCKPKL
ncbi:hypothetical protein NRB_06140 [Novosphingobium sp. 11B]